MKSVTHLVSNPFRSFNFWRVNIIVFIIAIFFCLLELQKRSSYCFAANAPPSTLRLRIFTLKSCLGNCCLFQEAFYGIINRKFTPGSAVASGKTYITDILNHMFIEMLTTWSQRLHTTSWYKSSFVLLLRSYRHGLG